MRPLGVRNAPRERQAINQRSLIANNVLSDSCTVPFASLYSDIYRLHLLDHVADYTQGVHEATNPAIAAPNRIG
jgi:hypothetical protein